MDNQLKVENWPIERLRPYERNPRKNDQAVPRMVNALREFGFRVPVLARSDGELIDGHLRYKAALAMGLSEVPVIVADDMSEQQIRAFRIMINRSATWADWDDELLLRELQALQLADVDLSITGFDDQELDKMLMDMAGEDKDPDKIPEISENINIKTGDVWVLGEHRLICGDCRDNNIVQKLLDGELLDMVWTDPPYNVDYSNKNKKLNKIYNGNRIERAIAADKMRDNDFTVFLTSAFENIFQSLKPGGVIYVSYAGTQSLTFYKTFQAAGFILSYVLVWRKNNMVLGRLDYQPQHEPIIYGWKPGKPHAWYGNRKQKSLFELGLECLQKLSDNSWQLTVGDKIYHISGENLVVDEYQTTILEISKPQSSRLHPTMKPVELIERMLSNSSRRGDIVGDFFGGSGSTLIACEHLGRKARVIELDPCYVDVIIRRWQEFTGGMAIHEASGETYNAMAGV